MIVCKTCIYFTFTCKVFLKIDENHPICDKYIQKPIRCRNCGVDLKDPINCEPENCKTCNEVRCGSNPHEFHNTVPLT